MRGEDRQLLQGARRVAPLPRVADADREARQAFDRLADVLAANGAGDDRLHVGDVQAIARGSPPIDINIDVAPAGQALGEGGTDAGHRRGHTLHRLGDGIDVGQVGAGHLDPDRALDAGGEHVDTVADRRNPDVGQPRYLHHSVQFLYQLFRGHAGSPLVTWLELNGGFEHLQRRRVGGGFGTARLAEYVLHFRHRPDQAVGQLQQLAGLLRRQAGQCRGHVKQVALVQRRQEFAAEPGYRPECTEEHQQRRNQGDLGMPQHVVQGGLVEADQPAVQRVLLLMGNPPANPVAHQHRHQGHREAGRRRHGVGLGERQRAEQTTFLGLQGEYRDE
ncbi:hypothetical protein FQZ97_367300 [compost metagenome]